MIRFLLTLFLAATYAGVALAAPEMVRDSVKIYFPVSQHYLDRTIPANQRALAGIIDSLSLRKDDSVYRLNKVVVFGAASPEGGADYNKALSQRRANTLFQFIRQYQDLPDSVMVFHFLGRDWHGLVDLAEKDTAIPFHAETLRLLRRLARESDLGIRSNGDQMTQLKRFRSGVPYRYMLRHLFPELRASRMFFWFERVPAPEPLPVIEPAPTDMVPCEPDTVYVYRDRFIEKPCRPFYMAVKTNMLYDLALTPNIGVEFYLGKRWSINANWMYAWWKTDRHHRYWRTYGGYLEGRKWFGSKAAEKPLQGHHLGVYAQIGTFDFEFGGEGRLAPRWMWGGGISYGYSLPIARRLNLEFDLGIGVLHGTVKDYIPVDNCYVWQRTRKYTWVGPTRAEISLVWLLGCDNYNRKRSKAVAEEGGEGL